MSRVKEICCVGAGFADPAVERGGMVYSAEGGRDERYVARAVQHGREPHRCNRPWLQVRIGAVRMMPTDGPAALAITLGEAP